MAKEVHYILFTREEVQSALLDYYAMVNQSFRPEFAKGLSLFHGPTGIAAAIGIESSVDHCSIRHNFAPSELASAMIQYCRNHRMPLARHADKTFDLFGDQLALMSTINLRSADPYINGNKVEYKDKDLERTRRRAGELAAKEPDSALEARPEEAAPPPPAKNVSK